MKVLAEKPKTAFFIGFLSCVVILLSSVVIYQVSRTQSAGPFDTFAMEYLNSKVNPEAVRNLTRNISELCGNNETCISNKSFYYLAGQGKTELYDSYFDALTINVKSPGWVLENNQIDCKSASVTYCSVMKSFNISCWIMITNNHAFNMIKINNSTKFVDVAFHKYGDAHVNEKIAGINVN